MRCAAVQYIFAKMVEAGAKPGSDVKARVDPFDPDASVTDIFGDMSGGTLLDAIFAQYQVGEKTRIKFFLDTNDVDNEKSPFQYRVHGIVRHLYNQRKHKGIKRAYMKSCQNRGIVEGVRGECWVTEPTPDQFGNRSGPHEALSFGSLCEAYYAALVADPLNPNLLRTLGRGIEVRRFSHKVPPAILKYMVKLHNRFHGGAGVSFIELMQTVPEVTWF